MPRISQKWAGFGTSVFSTMTRVANEHGAVNLAQGFPDFDGPPALIEAAAAALRSGANQYAPAPGLPALRQAAARRLARRYGLDYDPETEVTVTTGATEAIWSALQALLSPGDEILALEPFYDSYPAAAHAAGARLAPVRLAPPAWRVTREAVAAAVTPATRALIINTPHNPTGRVLSREELRILADVAVEHDLWVITDEVYDELTFAPAAHVPPATLPGMAARTLSIWSMAKTYSLTGWKVGYAAGPAVLTAALRAVHQFTVFCTATPLQAATVTALELPAAYYEGFRAEFARKRDFLSRTLTAAGFRPAPCEGTYFIMADYGGLSELPDQEMALALTREAGVAAIPLSPFLSGPAAGATSHWLRFAFCKQDATLAAAASRLTAWAARRRPGTT